MKAFPIIVLFLFMTSFFCLWGNGNSIIDSNEYSRNPYPNYVSPTPGEFPIIAWSPFYDRRNPTQHDFDTLKECGFNCAITPFDTTKLVPLLNGISDLGISLIPIIDYYYKRQKYVSCKNLLDRIYYHMQLNGIDSGFIRGIRVLDEPHQYEMHDLGKMCDSIRLWYPNVMPYVNLVGVASRDFMSPTNSHSSYSSDSLNRDTYSNYISNFYNEISPGVLSYDFYPLAYYSSTDSLVINYDDFYYDLQLYAQLSNEWGIPFWAFCQSTNKRTFINNSIEYRELPAATERYLRFEAFNALAFGAQGINYWRYANNSNVPSATSLYISSLVDTLGHKSLAWYAAQKINNEIRENEHIFLGARLQSYQFVGSSYLKPSVGTQISSNLGNFTAWLVSGKGALITRLSSHGSSYIMVVNQDPLHSTSLSFLYRSPAYTSALVYSRGMQTVSSENQNTDSEGGPMYTTSTIVLEPSGYFIYRCSTH